jgi:hypothetical protein
MADNACLFKLVAKSVGMKYNIMPTFMAKPWGDVSVSALKNSSNADIGPSNQVVQGALSGLFLWMS